MTVKKRDKEFLVKQMQTIIISIAKMIPENESVILINKTDNVQDFLKEIAKKLKEKEALGWDGSDLDEDKLNVLTLISEVYARRNKSKYKRVETPSEIVLWFVSWIEEVFRKSELSWKKFNMLG